VKTRVRSIVERVITYSLIVLAVGSLIYFLGSVNRKQQAIIRKKGVDLVSMKQKLTQAQNAFASRRKQVAKITAQLRDRKKEVRERFEKLLEKADNYTIFIEQVQRKAKALGIYIQDSHYSPPAKIAGAGGRYLEFKFNLRITGAYEKVKQFLWEMENALGRLVKITQMELIPPLADEQGNISLRLTLSTFFLP